MVNTLTITGLPAATSLSGTDEFMVMQGGTTSKKGTVAQLTTAQAGVTALQEVGYSTVAAAAAASVPTAVTALRTSGYAAAGDGGGARYKKVVAEPAHAGKIHSADGAWWEYVSDGPVNVLAFGADRTGVANSTTAVNNAIAFAIADTLHARVYLPYGLYLFNTTVTVYANMVVCGDGPKATIIRPGMTDGTGVFKLASGASFFTFRDLSIVTTMDFDNYVAGIANPQNCTAILANDVSVGHATRFYIDNVYIYGCAVGWNIIGWIITTTKFHIECCTLGLTASEFNAVDLNIHFENNRQDFVIVDSFGIVFSGMVAEAVVANTIASTIDNVDGITFISPYWEGGVAYPRTAPFLTIGETTLCQNVDITGATLSGSSGMAKGIAPVRVDNAETCSISVAVEQGTQGFGVETTVNTKNLVLREHMSLGGVPQDNSKGLGKLLNYFANSHFETWFRGWGSLQLANATFSKETTLVRRGLNALKVSATISTTYNAISLLLGYGVPTLVRGLNLRVGAWIWVPNITEYDESARTALPDIAIMSYNGATLVSSDPVNTKMVRNAWNYLYANVAVQADATEIYISIYPNNSATSVSGNEYLVVDSISVVENRCSLDDQMNGNYTDSDILPLFLNGRMELIGTQSTNANFTYAVGDKAWNPTIAAAGTPGVICTTGGAGDTAVWSNMASLV